MKSMLQKVGFLLSCNNDPYFEKSINILTSSADEFEKNSSRIVIYNMLITRFSDKKNEFKLDPVYETLYNTLLAKYKTNPNFVTEDELNLLLRVINSTFEKTKKEIKKPVLKSILAVTGLVAICVGEAVYVKNQSEKNGNNTSKNSSITLNLVTQDIDDGLLVDTLEYRNWYYPLIENSINENQKRIKLEI